VLNVGRSEAHLVWIARQRPFASLDVFDSFNGKQDFLLVAQFDDASVFQVLPGKLRSLLHSFVSLLSQSVAVLFKSQNSQPLFQRTLKQDKET